MPNFRDSNLFRFYRYRNRKDQQLLLDIEDWRNDRKLSRKLHVIKKLAQRGKRPLVIPEDVEMPEIPFE